MGIIVTTGFIVGGVLIGVLIGAWFAKKEQEDVDRKRQAQRRNR